MGYAQAQSNEIERLALYSFNFRDANVNYTIQISKNRSHDLFGR